MLTCGSDDDDHDHDDDDEDHRHNPHVDKCQCLCTEGENQKSTPANLIISLDVPIQNNIFMNMYRYKDSKQM